MASSVIGKEKKKKEREKKRGKGTYNLKKKQT